MKVKEKQDKKFYSVQFFRKVKEKIAKEISGMEYTEFIHYLERHRLKGQK